MAKWLREMLLVALMAAVTASAAEVRNQIDLKQFLTDPAALKKLVIAYSPPDRPTLYIFGTGRVVKQAGSTRILQSQGLRPTCTGQVGPDSLKDLVRTFIEHHFFALPVRSYVFATASDESEEFWKALRLHSIIVGDGENIASRQFAAGVYAGKQESIPPDFSAIENALERVEKMAIGTAPCRLAPGIKLPAAKPDSNIPTRNRSSSLS